MDEYASRQVKVFPVKTARGMRRIFVIAQALLVVAFGEALVYAVLISDGSWGASRTTRIALIAVGSLLALVWLGAAVATPARARKFGVIVSHTGVDLPSALLRHRVRVGWPDLVSVTEQPNGVIAWTYRAEGRDKSMRSRRLVTGPRVDSPALFAALSEFRVHSGKQFTVTTHMSGS